MFTHVYDGFFFYELLADSKDGWLSVSLHGHALRILKSSTVPVGKTGFPLPCWPS